MEKIKTYFIEAYDELVNKVSWPTMKELQSTSTVVLVAMVIIALLILIMDNISELSIVDLLYKQLLS